MHALLLAFRLSDADSLEDLLRELNLHDGVDARVKDDRPDGAPVVLIALDDVPETVWAVRSTVSLFDPGAVEVHPEDGR